MFMSCIGTFGSIVERKEDENVIWELIYELHISYELCKENTKSNELIGIYCVQCLMWSTKLPFIGLDYEVWEVNSVLNQK